MIKQRFGELTDYASENLKYPIAGTTQWSFSIEHLSISLFIIYFPHFLLKKFICFSLLATFLRLNNNFFLRKLFNLQSNLSISIII